MVVIMDAFWSWLASLPPVPEFFPPTPKAYSVIMSIFQYFPVVSLQILQLNKVY